MAQSGRTYSAARFAVAVDGTPAGFAISVSGGERFAEVLERPGTGGLVDKHLGPVQFEPIVLEIGAAPGPLLDWVRDALAGAAKTHDGVISLLDYTNRERQRLEWTNGVLVEIAFPTADAADRNDASLHVKIHAEATRLAAGSNLTVGLTASVASKQIRHNNFRWEVAGLKQACRKTRTVSAVTFHLRAAPDDAGAVRPGAGNPTRVVDDVTFTVPTSDAQTYRGWFDDLADGTGTERTAQLRLPLAQPEGRHAAHRPGRGRRVPRRRRASRQRLGGDRLDGGHDVLRERRPCLDARDDGPATGRHELVAGDRHHRPGPPSFSAGVIAGRTPTTASSPQSIADRLLATTTTAPSAPADATEWGRWLGRAWASDVAGLGELDDVAALADGGEWTGLALDGGGSLVAFLTDHGVLDPAAPTPGELDRDDLVAGLVAGAAEVRAAVTPLLAAGRADAAPPPPAT